MPATRGGQLSPRNFQERMYLSGTAISYIIPPPARKYRLVAALHESDVFSALCMG